MLASSSWVYSGIYKNLLWRVVDSKKIKKTCLFIGLAVSEVVWIISDKRRLVMKKTESKRPFSRDKSLFSDNEALTDSNLPYGRMA